MPSRLQFARLSERFAPQSPVRCLRRWRARLPPSRWAAGLIGEVCDKVYDEVCDEVCGKVYDKVILEGGTT